MVTFAVIGLGISLLLIKNCDHRRNATMCESTEEEAMELVPHITLNPSFNIDMLEYIEASENQPGGGGGQDDPGGGGVVVGAAADEINLVNSPVRHGSNSVRPNG